MRKSNIKKARRNARIAYHRVAARYNRSAENKSASETFFDGLFDHKAHELALELRAERRLFEQNSHN